MSPAIFARNVAAISVFFLFTYLATSSKPALMPMTSATRDTVSVIGEPEKSAPDFRQLALEFPDSLLPFCRGVLTEKQIALSFDACPTSGKNHFNKAVFKVLQQTKAPATIFLSGEWIVKDTSAIRLLASDTLIELANHSFTHPHMTLLQQGKIKEEITRTQDIISNLTGQKSFLFRAPYGEYNDTLINIARQLGLVTVQFDVESGDPDSSFTAERLVAWVTKEARNGSVIIMHINNRGWHTAEALPTIIQDLRAKGFQLVKVSDLLKHSVEMRSGNLATVTTTDSLKTTRE